MWRLKRNTFGKMVRSWPKRAARRTGHAACLHSGTGQARPLRLRRFPARGID